MKKLTGMILLALAVSLSVTSFGQEQDPISITAERFEIDGKANVVDAINDVTLTQKDITITAAKARYRQKEKEVYLSGNIVALQKDLKLTCDEVWFYGKENKLVAQGNVKVSYQEIKASAVKAAFLTDTQELTLTGRPRAFRGRDQLIGDQIIVFLKSKKINISGKTKVILSQELITREVR
jgi:lipopolysaccharide transport protein LptA